MKKVLIVAAILFAGLIAIRFFAGGEEDGWICTNGSWERHGNPKEDRPVSGCGEEKQTSEAIIGALSLKYGKPADEFVVTTTFDSGIFAKGMVSMKGEPGGAIWFGAKTEKGWELVADGQGPMECATADKYKLPKDMVPSCLDTNNKLFQR